MKNGKTVVALAAGLLLSALAVVGLDLAGWPGLALRLAARAGLGLQMDAAARLHLLWRPGLQAARLRVLAASGETLADASGVELAWQWRDIEAWRHGAALRLRRVQVDVLALNWQRDAAGRSPWPLQTHGHADGPTPLPQIDHLVIRAGSARLDDAALQLLGEARFDTAADGRWSAGLHGRLRGQQLALTAEASAGLALLSPAQAGPPPVHLVAEMRQGDDRISFAGTATSLLDARAGRRPACAGPLAGGHGSPLRPDAAAHAATGAGRAAAPPGRRLAAR